MATVLPHLVVFTLLLGILVLFFRSFGRISISRERDLRALARRHGWVLPETIDWKKLRFDAKRGDRSVVVDVNIARTLARTAYQGEKVLVRRHDPDDARGVYPGLEVVRSGDPSFDERFEVFSVSGTLPPWLSEEVRAAMRSLDESATLTVDQHGLAAEILRPVQDAGVLQRLIDLVAAALDPSFARSSASELREPVSDRKPLAESYFRAMLIVLPLALLIGVPLNCVPAISKLQSRIICGPRVELDSKVYGVGQHRQQRGCGGVSEGLENFTAGLLAVEAVAVPMLVVALIFVRVRRRGRG